MLPYLSINLVVANSQKIHSSIFLIISITSIFMYLTIIVITTQWSVGYNEHSHIPVISITRFLMSIQVTALWENVRDTSPVMQSSSLMEPATFVQQSYSEPSAQLRTYITTMEMMESINHRTWCFLIANTPHIFFRIIMLPNLSIISIVTNYQNIHSSIFLVSSITSIFMYLTVIVEKKQWSVGYNEYSHKPVISLSRFLMSI
jgi:hypothetical protein